MAITFSASWYKVFDENPRIGFLSHAAGLASGAIPAKAEEVQRLILNDRLDAAVTGMLVVLVALILLESALEWWRVLSGKKLPVTNESPYIAAEPAGANS